MTPAAHCPLLTARCSHTTRCWVCPCSTRPLPCATSWENGGWGSVVRHLTGSVAGQATALRRAQMLADSPAEEINTSQFEREVAAAVGDVPGVSVSSIVGEVRRRRPLALACRWPAAGRPLPFLELRFHCLTSTFHCLSPIFHCLSALCPTFHCHSLTFHCLAGPADGWPQRWAPTAPPPFTLAVPLKLPQNYPKITLKLPQNPPKGCTPC